MFYLKILLRFLLPILWLFYDSLEEMKGNTQEQRHCLTLCSVLSALSRLCWSNLDGSGAVPCACLAVMNSPNFIIRFTTWYSGFPRGSGGKVSACNAGDLGSIPGSGRSPGEGNGYSFQYLAWRIPWIEEPDRLQSMWSQKVRHDWATSTFIFQRDQLSHSRFPDSEKLWHNTFHWYRPLSFWVSCYAEIGI